MPDQANPPIAFLEKPQTPEWDLSLTGVFLESPPAMAGIVTIITLPFAQESLHNTPGLPVWLPFTVEINPAYEDIETDAVGRGVLIFA